MSRLREYAKQIENNMFMQRGVDNWGSMRKGFWVPLIGTNETTTAAVKRFGGGVV